TGGAGRRARAEHPGALLLVRRARRARARRRDSRPRREQPAASPDRHDREMTRSTAALTMGLLLAVSCGRRGAGGTSRVPVTVACAAQRAIQVELIDTGNAVHRPTAAVATLVADFLTTV